MTQRHKLTAVALLTALAAAASGCSSTDKPADSDARPATSSSTTAPSPGAQSSSPRPEEQAGKEAAAAYRAYWQVVQDYYASEKPDPTLLQKHATSVALRQVEEDVRAMRKEGQIATGAVALETPTVTKTDLDRKVPTVSLSTCIDVSKWKIQDARTGKAADLDRGLDRYVIKAFLEKWPQGWTVLRDEPQGTKC
ncbi:hypothetical protein [Streptomyces sp. NRRL F-5630]|uniref:hypothetical protein n=1 Tax=Streptomyces sp. NRRL F-5630 TaxID=1463864 RepID=UPI003D73309F